MKKDLGPRWTYTRNVKNEEAAIFEKVKGRKSANLDAGVELDLTYVATSNTPFDQNGLERRLQRDIVEAQHIIGSQAL